jgi:hypothetical protein
MAVAGKDFFGVSNQFLSENVAITAQFTGNAECGPRGKVSRVIVRIMQYLIIVEKKNIVLAGTSNAITLVRLRDTLNNIVSLPCPVRTKHRNLGEIFPGIFCERGKEGSVVGSIFLG